MFINNITRQATKRLPNLIPSDLTHARYLLVAKTRATVLGVAMKHIPMPRPTLHVGTTATEDLCESMVKAGYQKVLIVTDAVLAKLGVIDNAKTYLSDHGIECIIYDGVTPDPTFSVINQGLIQSKQSGCQAVLAIGGGSVIDAAKMIATAQGNDCNPKKLVGLFKARKPALPLYAIPSTAGTGSEATIGAVVSDDKTHQKSIAVDPKMVPIAAAIDANIMKGMPPHVTADTGIDVLTHAIEAWVSNVHDEDADYYAACAIGDVFEYLPRAYAQGDDLEAREKMGVAAHYAGIALNKTGLGYVHAIAHQLGAYYGIPHGRANAIVLPHVLKFNAEVSEQRIAKLAKRTGQVDDYQLSNNVISGQFIKQIEDLIKQVGIDLVIPDMLPEDFHQMATAVAKEVSDTYAVPKYMTFDDIKQILRAIRHTSKSIH